MNYNFVFLNFNSGMCGECDVTLNKHYLWEEPGFLD